MTLILIKPLENKNITEEQVFHMSQKNNNLIKRENQVWLLIQRKFKTKVRYLLKDI